jgi:hypothetical protein
MSFLLIFRKFRKSFLLLIISKKIVSLSDFILTSYMKSTPDFQDQRKYRYLQHYKRYKMVFSFIPDFFCRHRTFIFFYGCKNFFNLRYFSPASNSYGHITGKRRNWVFFCCHDRTFFSKILFYDISHSVFIIFAVIF